MKRIVLSLLTAVALLVQSTHLVVALTLNNIGSAPVTGNITSFTYMGTNPAFKGTTDPSAAVTINLQGANQTVTADGTGSWIYTPTGLQTAGSYPVIITSGDESMSFTLTISSATQSATSSTTSATSSSTGNQPTLPNELPQTGTAEQTLFLLLGGFGFVTGGILFYWKIVPKLLLEESQEVMDDRVA